MTAKSTTNPDYSSNPDNKAVNNRAVYLQIVLVVAVSIMLTVSGSLLFDPSLWLEVLVSSALTGIVGVGVLIWTIKRITRDDKLIASSWMIGTGIRFITFAAMGMILILAAKYSPLAVLLPGLLIYLICMLLDVLQVKRVINLPTINQSTTTSNTCNQDRQKTRVADDNANNNNNNNSDHFVEASL